MSQDLERYLYEALRGELKALRRLVSQIVKTASGGLSQLTGDVTAGPGTGSQVATIASNAVTFAKMQDIQASKLVGRGSAAGTGDPQEITLGTGLSMSGTTLNATGSYDDEQAQDAVGTILVDSATVDFTYNDATPSITAIVIDDSITDAKLRNSGATSVIGRSANSTGDPADISTSTDGQVLRRASGVLGFGALDLADSDAVTGDLPITNLGSRRASVSISFDNNGVELADNTKARWRVPNGVTATLVRWSIAADVGGAIVINIWKDTWANYPPVSGDSIIGSGTAPTITATNDHNESTSFTGYTTTTFSGGDSVVFNIDSCTTITACDLELEFDVIQ